MSNSTCAIDGCEMHTTARGWCSKHYTRWQRYQDPEHRMPGEVRDGRRICSRCREDTRLADYSPGNNICKECKAAAKREKYEPRPFVPLPIIHCIQCGVRFQPHERKVVVCSLECRTQRKRDLDHHYQYFDGGVSHNEAGRRWRTRNIDAAADNSRKYRARKLGAFVEEVSSLVVAERDGWTCQLCMGPIDRYATWPDPLSRTVDHRVPLIAGGAHSYENCQAAHLRCNVSKGARITT